MRFRSRTTLISAIALAAAATAGAVAAPAALSAGHGPPTAQHSCDDPCRDTLLIKGLTGGQTTLKWKMLVENAAPSKKVMLGDVTLTGACAGGFSLVIAAAHPGLHGTLSFHGGDVESGGVNYTRLDTGLNSRSQDSLNDVSDGGRGGAGVAEVLLLNGRIETIDYGYGPGTKSGSCAYWGDATFG
jgi:hypothetical protein